MDERATIEHTQRMRSDLVFRDQEILKSLKGRRRSALLQSLSFRRALKDYQKYGRSPERDEGLESYRKAHQAEHLLRLRREIQEYIEKVEAHVRT